jgi:hypothetical protein
MALFENVKRTNPKGLTQDAQMVIDFTGGLHVGASASTFAENEVRAATNVDFRHEGGVRRRRAINPLTASDDILGGLGGTPGGGVIPFNDAGVLKYYTQRLDASTFAGTSQDFEFAPASGSWDTTAGDVQGYVGKSVNIVDFGLGAIETVGDYGWFQVGSKLYVGDGVSAWRQWDGTTATTLGTTLRLASENWEGTGYPDFSTFNKGGIPIGSVAAVWDSRVWIGDTPEALGGSSALYYSFTFGLDEEDGPLDFYEDWQYQFNPGSGFQDRVIKLVPVQGRMYVFLPNKIMVITPRFGEPIEVFYQVDTFTDSIGAVGPRSIVEHEGSVWFFNKDEGLMQITPDGQLIGHSKKVKKAFEAPRLGDDLLISVGALKDRAWVSLPTGQALWNDETYVYDWVIQAWTYYDIGIAGFVPDTDYAVVNKPIAAMVELDREDDFTVDYFGQERLDATARTERDIIGSFSTMWFDANLTEAFKTWRAFEFLMDSCYLQSMTVNVYRDWEPRSLGDSWTFDTWNPDVLTATATPITYTESTVLSATTSEREPFWDDPTETSVGISTDLDLGYSYGTYPLAVRQRSRVSSRSVSLVFTAQNSQSWSMDRLTLFYKRRPVRT